jgi:glycosyltransferase involved in cell wall biosynthesis
MSIQRIGITWQITDLHGWGVFGLNLSLELARHGPVPPLLISPPYIASPTPKIKRLLGPYLNEQPDVMQRIEQSADVVRLPDTVLLHSLGNAFMHAPISDQVQGDINVGFIFFENGDLDDAALERARRYDKIIAGSGWNRDLIRAHGFESCAFVSQGVDLERFKPRTKTNTFGDRFVVFSGGKLELRKGQDTVLMAFKRFHERHPDALLLSNWHNPWPDTVADMTRSPYFQSAPGVNADGSLNLSKWIAESGLPAEAHVDVGAVPNALLPQIFAEVDVALFANRCEGGTNLVAMESMASGIPCILSANSGHKDIIADGNCYPLHKQTPSPASVDRSGIWHESDIDEIVEALEQAYSDREEARRRARAGVAFMQRLSWHNQSRQLVGELSEFMV